MNPSPSAFQRLDVATRAELRRLYVHRDLRERAAIRIEAKRAAGTVPPLPRFTSRAWRRMEQYPHAGSHRLLASQPPGLGAALAARPPRYGTAPWYEALRRERGAK